MKMMVDTKQRLLEAATKEFLEFGYKSGNIRRICKIAETTTGSFYHFFIDKEDVFDYLVKDTAEMLRNSIIEHTKGDAEKSWSTSFAIDQEDFADSIKIMEMLYEHRIEFVLLFQKSSGTKYENYVNDIVNLIAEHYAKWYKTFSEKNGYEPIDDYVFYWIANTEFKAIAGPMLQNLTLEEAYKEFKVIYHYLNAGWHGIFQTV